MRFRDADPSVRRFERNAAIAWIVMILVALAVGRPRLDAALGVVAGGLLMAISYGGIKGGVDALLVRRKTADHAPGGAPAGSGGDADAGSGRPAGGRSDRPRRRPVVWLVAQHVGRYALLVLAAYVILTRFRVHPVGVLSGATVPFVAAVIELFRAWRRGAVHGRSK